MMHSSGLATLRINGEALPMIQQSSSIRLLSADNFENAGTFAVRWAAIEAPHSEDYTWGHSGPIKCEARPQL
jgi:hypothetical protein